MTKAMHTPEAHAKRAAMRAANIASTRPTTRPGSESTNLRVGDRVVVAVEDPRSTVSRRYGGREGWVATVNTQRFDSGTRYVEIGVSWTWQKDMEKMSADIWFRADEVRAVS
jgi:hypothetical protein